MCDALMRPVRYRVKKFACLVWVGRPGDGMRLSLFLVCFLLLLPFTKGFHDVDVDPGDKSGFARYLAKRRFMVQSSKCPETLKGVRSSLLESHNNIPGANQSRWLRGGKGDIQSVVFQVHCTSTTMDEDVGIIGENKALGSWNAAVRMRADKVKQSFRFFIL